MALSKTTVRIVLALAILSAILVNASTLQNPDKRRRIEENGSSDTNSPVALDGVPIFHPSDSHSIREVSRHVPIYHYPSIPTENSFNPSEQAIQAHSLHQGSPQYDTNVEEDHGLNSLQWNDDFLEMIKPLENDASISNSYSHDDNSGSVSHTATLIPDQYGVKRRHGRGDTTAHESGITRGNLNTMAQTKTAPCQGQLEKASPRCLNDHVSSCPSCGDVPGLVEFTRQWYEKVNEQRRLSEESRRRAPGDTIAHESGITRANLNTMTKQKKAPCQGQLEKTSDRCLYNHVQNCPSCNDVPGLVEFTRQ